MVNKIEIFTKDGMLLASWEVEKDICQKFSLLKDEEIVFEIVGMLIVNLKEETGMEFTPNMILNELSKVVVCGREIKI
ncbi:MAG: hypothetical protein ABGX27_05630 [Desulfurobacteriaceae bacterium]